MAFLSSILDVSGNPAQRAWVKAAVSKIPDQIRFLIGQVAEKQVSQDNEALQSSSAKQSVVLTAGFNRK